jgi:hypothetical protein
MGVKRSMRNQLFFYDQLIRIISRLNGETTLVEIEAELEASRDWSRGTTSLKFALEDYLVQLRNHVNSRD